MNPMRSESRRSVSQEVHVSIIVPVFVSLLSLFGSVLLTEDHAMAQSLDVGAVSFSNSGAPQAQAAFQRGVAALHSFWYDEARAAFQETQRLDPDFALAYWGEAMTYNHPLWDEVEGESARTALNRLAPTPETRIQKARTPRERMFLAAIEALYEDEVDEKRQRDEAYSESMARLFGAYPTDVEAASFYALSILGTIQPGEGMSKAIEAAGILEGFFNPYPQHPGVLHYLIHAYDDPLHAPLGLRPARIYAQIAPTSSHALHMPSHIFVQRGMWEEAAASNEEAYAVSLALADRPGHTIDERDYHSLYWLLHAYLQLGRHEQARQVLDQMTQIARQHEAPTIQVHHALMQARYVIEAEAWDQAPDPATARAFSSDGIKSSILLASGMAAVHTGRLDVAGEVAAILRTLKTQNQDAGIQERADQLAVQEFEIEALIARAEGHHAEALDWLQQAAALEQTLELPTGPPVPAKPALELYGEVLLALGQPEGALQQFEYALQRMPARSQSLLGAARAAEAADQNVTAGMYYARLRTNWRKADATLRGLRDMQHFFEKQGENMPGKQH